MEGNENKPKVGKTKKPKPIVVSKENLLYQPWKLIKSGYDATAFQQNVIISVLRKLKNSLAYMRDEYVSGARQLSLFETADAALYREEDDAMTFNIHMKELGVEPQNYQRAFNAVCNIGDIDVWVPVSNPEGNKEELERAKLFSIIVKKEDVIVDENNQVIGYKYEKHNPQVKLKLRRNVAETLFQGQIHTFLEETAMNISEKFPKRLYMYFANYKNIGELTIDYWRFRQQIGFEDQNTEKIQYPKFYDFRKRVLDPSVKKLREMAEMGQAEYWFEYEAIYKGTGRAKSPDLLKFTIHLSQIGEDYEKQKGSFRVRKEIEDCLSDVFEQTAAQVRKLISALNSDEYDAFKHKMAELQSYFEYNRAKIKDKRSYANRVLTDFVMDTKAEREKRNMFERQNDNISFRISTDGELEATNGELENTSQSVAVKQRLMCDKIVVNSKNLITEEEFDQLETYLHKLSNDKERKIIVDALTIDKMPSGFVVYSPSMSTYNCFQSIWDSIISELDDLFDTDVSFRVKQS